MIPVAFVGALSLVVVLLVAQRRRVFPSLFAIVSFVFINFGFFLKWTSSDSTTRDSIANGVIVTSVGLVSVVTGMFIANRVHDKWGSSCRQREWSFARYTKFAQDSERFPSWNLAAMAIVVLVPTWLYFIAIGFVPLFDGVIAVVTSGSDGLGVLNESRLSRDDFVNADAVRVPLQGLLEIYRNVGVPVVFAFALAQIRRGLPRLPRVVLMAVCVVSVMAAGQRWPLMYLLFAAIFVLTAERMTSVPRKPLIALGITAVVAGVTLSALQARTVERQENVIESALFGVQNLIWRITTGQVEVPVASYVMDEISLRWQFGATYLQSLASFLPGKGESYPVTFYQIVTGDTRAFTAPPDLYTEAYINFSWYGVVVLCLVWGFIMVTLEQRLFQSQKPWDIAMHAGLLTILVFTSLSSTVFSLSFLFVAVGCLVANFLGTTIAKRWEGIRQRNGKRDIDDDAIEPGTH